MRASTTPPLPLDLPAPSPEYRDIRLRAFAGRDVSMLRDLATDPYVPLIGSLPGHATRDQAVEYIERQRDRLATGAGYSFCVAERATDAAVGQAGLWLAPLEQGRTTAGYCIAPGSRGRGLAGQALTALTSFAWSVPGLHRIELYIEPWNAASARTAAVAGYAYEGLLRSHQEIGGRRVDMRLFAALRPT